jgi:hypothetical protein
MIKMKLDIKYTNLLGLIALMGAVAGIIVSGSLFVMNPWYAVPFIALAVVSACVFALYIYHFMTYGSTIQISEEDMLDESTKDIDEH